MTRVDFERMLAFHCAPVLMGLKPANLIAVSRKQAPELPVLLAEYQRIFLGEDLKFLVLCSCKSREMILVYRPSLLEMYLQHTAIKAYLVGKGYPRQGDIEVFLHILMHRYQLSESVPHEIGIFLGYPLEDVLGFQQHRGKDYKISGYWKVYGDAEHAEQAFRSMDRCREFACNRISRGYSLEQIVKMKHLCAA